MEVLKFPGRFQDATGGEPIAWRVESSRRYLRPSAKSQYLAVRNKADYWSVPVTEEVPETYLCHERQRRIPGAGYRG